MLTDPSADGKEWVYHHLLLQQPTDGPGRSVLLRHCNQLRTARARCIKAHTMIDFPRATFELWDIDVQDYLHRSGLSPGHLCLSYCRFEL